MYSDIANQAANLSKFFMAFLVLFLILPNLIVGKIDEDRADDLASKYIRAVICVIFVGYFLVEIKLFEFITLFGIIIILIYRKLLKDAKVLGKRSHESSGLFILRFLDKQINIVKSVILKIRETRKTPIKSLIHYNLDTIIFFVLTATVLLISAYLRFNDAITHAAMPLSDSYITLDWLKGVERRQLFYEPGGGVYPRGLSIFMATIHKFSFIDALYVVKYVGPLNGLFIVVSILYVVYKITGNKYGALIAATLYGIGARLLGSDFERQAATNSQEFALVFFLPTIYFTYKFLKERRQRDCITAIAGLTLLGLIHTFVYIFGVLAVSIHIFILFLQNPAKNFKDYIKLISGGFISAVISLTPFVIGLLDGVGLHGSSVEFLTQTGDILLRKLSIMDYFQMVAFFIFSIILIVMMVRREKQVFSLLPIYFTIICMFFIYFAGAYITKSTLLDARTTEIWAIFIVLVIGLSTGFLLARIRLFQLLKGFSYLICIFLFVLVWRYAGTSPLEPYKMEWDSGVEQYLNIAKEYNPKSWTMVAEERQYAMVTGTGFLVTTANFVSDYSAKQPFQDTWLNIGEHIFIYQQKNIFKVDEANFIYSIEAPKYEKMAEDGKAMDLWLNEFTASGGSYHTYYEDQNIRILYIYNKAYEDLDQKKLWGE